MCWEDFLCTFFYSPITRWWVITDFPNLTVESLILWITRKLLISWFWLLNNFCKSYPKLHFLLIKFFPKLNSFRVILVFVVTFLGNSFFFTRLGKMTVLDTHRHCARAECHRNFCRQAKKYLIFFLSLLTSLSIRGVRGGTGHSRVLGIMPRELMEK